MEVTVVVVVVMVVVVVVVVMVVVVKSYEWTDVGMYGLNGWWNISFTGV